MSDEMKTYRFGDETIQAPASVSVEDVREAWRETFPAIAGAEVLTAEDGTVVFLVRGGDKG